MARISYSRCADSTLSVALAAAAALVGASVPFAVTAATTVVGLSGETAPNGAGAFTFFGTPSISSSEYGQARLAFRAGLTDPVGGYGVFAYDGSLKSVARTGDTAPFGGGVLESFGDPAINRYGYLAYRATLTDTPNTVGIFSYYFYSPGSTQQHGRSGQDVYTYVDGSPGNSVLTDFGSPVLGVYQTPIFAAQMTGPSTSAIVRGSQSPSTPSPIAYAGGNIGALSGRWSSFGAPAAGAESDYMAVAFRAWVQETTYSEAIFRYTDFAGMKLVAYQNGPIPDGVGGFATFGDPVVSQAGELAFHASLSGTAADQGIFRGKENNLIQIARKGDESPDFNGTLGDLYAPAINKAGQVAFRAQLTGTSGGSADDEAILRGSGGTLTRLAREGQLVSDGNGKLATLGDPAINGPGIVLFQASLTGTAGGASDNQGLFLSDGIDLVKAARLGDSLSGSTVTQLAAHTGPDPGGLTALNDLGQVAYHALLADGREGVFLFTPDLGWRSSTSGDWDTGANWTLGLVPAPLSPNSSSGQTPSAVSISPASGDITVTLSRSGPPLCPTCETYTNVGPLTLAPAPGATATLSIAKGELSAEEVSIATGASIVAAGGRFSSPVVALQGGHLDLGGGSSYIGEVSGFGTLRGFPYFSLGNATAENGLLDIGSAATMQAYINSLTVKPGGSAKVEALDLRMGRVSTTGGSVVIGVASQTDYTKLAFVEASGGATVEVHAKALRAGGAQVSDGARLLLDTSGAQSVFEGTIILSGGEIVAAGGVRLEEDRSIRGHGAVKGAVTMGPVSSIRATGGVLALGDDTRYDGFQTDGGIVVEQGATLALKSYRNMAKLGNVTTVEGGMLASATGVYLDGHGVISGRGVVAAPVAAQLGSTVVATGDLELGSASAFDGFYSDGRLYTDNHTVTLRDRDRAVLGSLTEIGNVAGPGGLNAPNGTVLEFGKTLSGYGVVTGSLLNNGFVNGEGPNAFDYLDLQGLVTGVGDFGGTIAFSGGFSPGLSPTETQAQNVIMTASNVFTVEIAGRQPGSEYDRLVASGFVMLGGKLKVELLNGFKPVAGDLFTFILASSITQGSGFSETLFPDLGDLRWVLAIESTAASLRVEAVPLPAAVWMFGAALVGLGFLQRRRES